MLEVIIASKNEGKIREIKEIYPNIHFISLKDLNDDIEIEETGDTFYENALIKAKTIALKYHKLTLADDSGICVKALDNRPGINSHRYSKEGTDEANNLKLVEELKGKSDRSCFYECVMVLTDGKEILKSSSGQVHGTFLDHPLGHNGFGYDPYFYLEEYKLTFGELNPVIKNEISHRAIALKGLKDIFGELTHEKE